MPSTSGLLAGTTSPDTSNSLVVANSKQPITPHDILPLPKAALHKDRHPGESR